MTAWLEQNAGRVPFVCRSCATRADRLPGAFGQATGWGGSIRSSAAHRPHSQDGALCADQLSKDSPEPVWARNAVSKTVQNRCPVLVSSQSPPTQWK